MSVKATAELRLTVDEVPSAAALPYGTEGQTTVKSNGLNLSITYTDTSTPNAKKAAYQALPLVAGVAALDLSACPGFGALPVDMTGQKVRAVLFRAGKTNTAPITVKKGAANGFTGFGATFSLTLAPGRQALVMANDDVVGAANKVLDVTGTGAEVLEFILVTGDN